MIDNFKKKDGMFIIEVGEDTYYMRSHPKNMYFSMLNKKHDNFLAYKYSIGYKSLGKAHERILPHSIDIVLNINDLEKYIRKVEA